MLPVAPILFFNLLGAGAFLIFSRRRDKESRSSKQSKGRRGLVRPNNKNNNVAQPGQTWPIWNDATKVGTTVPVKGLVKKLSRTGPARDQGSWWVSPPRDQLEVLKSTTARPAGWGSPVLPVHPTLHGVVPGTSVPAEEHLAVLESDPSPTHTAQELEHQPAPPSQVEESLFTFATSPMRLEEAAAVITGFLLLLTGLWWLVRRQMGKGGGVTEDPIASPPELELVHEPAPGTHIKTSETKAPREQGQVSPLVPGESAEEATPADWGSTETAQGPESQMAVPEPCPCLQGTGNMVEEEDSVHAIGRARQQLSEMVQLGAGREGGEGGGEAGGGQGESEGQAKDKTELREEAGASDMEAYRTIRHQAEELRAKAWGGVRDRGGTGTGTGTEAARAGEGSVVAKPLLAFQYAVGGRGFRGGVFEGWGRDGVFGGLGNFNGYGGTPRPREFVPEEEAQECSGAPLAKTWLPSHCEFVKEIGTGRFGTAWETRVVGTSKKVALKVIKKEDVLAMNCVNQIEMETTVLKTCRGHPNVLSGYGNFFTTNQIYLVLQLAEGGNLCQLMQLQPGRRFCDPLCAFFVSQIVSGVGFLHSRGFIHRDLKPENLLLDIEGNVLVADFGCAVLLASPRSRCTGKCGTRNYMAPEMVLELSYGYGLPVDVWAVGVVAFELLHGYTPFSLKPREKRSESAPWHFFKENERAGGGGRAFDDGSGAHHHPHRSFTQSSGGTRGRGPSTCRHPRSMGGGASSYELMSPPQGPDEEGLSESSGSVVSLEGGGGALMGRRTEPPLPSRQKRRVVRAEVAPWPEGWGLAETMRRIVNNDYDFVHGGAKARDFVRKLLGPFPETRPTMAQASQEPWLDGARRRGSSIAADRVRGRVQAEREWREMMATRAAQAALAPARPPPTLQAVASTTASGAGATGANSATPALGGATATRRVRWGEGTMPGIGDADDMAALEHVDSHPLAAGSPESDPRQGDSGPTMASQSPQGKPADRSTSSSMSELVEAGAVAALVKGAQSPAQSALARAQATLASQRAGDGGETLGEMPSGGGEPIPGALELASA